MNTQTKTKTIDTEVLFQKIANTWYVFAEVDGEFLFRALPQGVDPKTTQFDFMQVVADQEKKAEKNFEMVA